MDLIDQFGQKQLGQQPTHHNHTHHHNHQGGAPVEREQAPQLADGYIKGHGQNDGPKQNQQHPAQFPGQKTQHNQRHDPEQGAGVHTQFRR